MDNHFHLLFYDGAGALGKFKVIKTVAAVLAMALGLSAIVAAASVIPQVNGLDS